MNTKLAGCVTVIGWINTCAEAAPAELVRHNYSGSVVQVAFDPTAASFMAAFDIVQGTPITYTVRINTDNLIDNTVSINAAAPRSLRNTSWRAPRMKQMRAESLSSAASRSASSPRSPTARLTATPARHPIPRPASIWLWFVSHGGVLQTQISGDTRSFRRAGRRSGTIWVDNQRTFPLAVTSSAETP